jgi:hypothetical protein
VDESTGGEKSLEAQGWTRQFIANEPRLTEAADMYRDLGFEVLLEPLPKEPECTACEGTDGVQQRECRVCFQGVEDQYRIIYTRPYKKMEAGDAELS